MSFTMFRVIILGIQRDCYCCQFCFRFFIFTPDVFHNNHIKPTNVGFNFADAALARAQFCLKTCVFVQDR